MFSLGIEPKISKLTHIRSQGMYTKWFVACREYRSWFYQNVRWPSKYCKDLNNISSQVSAQPL